LSAMGDPVDIRIRLLLTFGAASGLVSVIMGALAAHALETGQIETVRTAAQYQGIHALALLATGALALTHRNLWLETAGWLFVSGTLMFCGSLYLKTLAGIPALAPVAPFGGAAFMIGWACLAVGSWRLRPAA